MVKCRSLIDTLRIDIKKKQIKTHMNKYIKYRRIEGQYNNEIIQDLFDELIASGDEIIYYNERNARINDDEIIHVVIVVGRIKSIL